MTLIDIRSYLAVMDGNHVGQIASLSHGKLLLRSGGNGQPASGGQPIIAGLVVDSEAMTTVMGTAASVSSAACGGEIGAYLKE
ncbi:hypothetical protein EV130_101776 [Rhizobium azibense]|uniref:Uncharacterized protein n=2 Tax=Rhizobium azibense TaxID=1136135 RepID=A0A4R3RB41_9HYPH|nr:hypothetical protein EV130_101776 [Rhizobium azibense]